MKTAMQKLITNLETMGITFPQGIQQTFLSIEKEQIIESFCSGVYEGIWSDINENTKNENAEEYYNRTFNQNES